MNNYLRNVAVLRKIQLARDKMEPPEYWERDEDDEEGGTKMKTDYVCNYCGEELVVTPKLVGEYLTILVTPCKSCVAQGALLAAESGWVKRKLEKEAAA